MSRNSVVSTWVYTPACNILMLYIDYYIYYHYFYIILSESIIVIALAYIRKLCQATPTFCLGSVPPLCLSMNIRVAVTMSPSLIMSSVFSLSIHHEANTILFTGVSDEVFRRDLKKRIG